MSQLQPEPLPEVYTAGQQQQIVPAHHRPPNVMYQNGVPYHFTIGQPPPPANIVVNLPEQQGMSREQREFMMYVIMWLVVAVVLCGCVCAVTVIVGGTLMGIIGVVTANLPFIGVTLVGLVLAAGWAAAKVRPAGKKTKP